ncbi:glycerate kinase [Desulfovibrio cuneatus]|uniref:glycerate kinase n=1 Tax=Desulfovibrio cuneatus TaxID=159728 RepID=UPI00041F8833|nr:glycerate kinase [Desulfovibrio cuneatus]
MRVLIAPDSFKGSLSALQAAKAMAQGVLRVFPHAEIDMVPMADGGEGTVEALVNATSGTLHTHTVQDPLGRPIEAVWGMLGGGRTAVVEMAAASGLPLLHTHERDPLRACTHGTGELIATALEALHSSEVTQSDPEHTTLPRLVVGIGGSATNDGGSGALRALGAVFHDAQGAPLPPGGAALASLKGVTLANLHPLLAKTSLLVACDVDNPLCGPRGASAVFGPQKGATAQQVQQLDAALHQFAKVSASATGKDMINAPGAGAAGGLGAGLLFYTPAQLVPGVSLVLEATNFAARVAKADLVITGEGRTDSQTMYGKAPVGVAKAAKAYGKPVLCLSGALGEEANTLYSHGIDGLASVVCAIASLEECVANAHPLLCDAAERACRLIALGKTMPR